MRGCPSALPSAALLLLHQTCALSENSDKSYLRRAFVDALPKDIHGPEASKPAEAVLRLNKLFKMKKE